MIKNILEKIESIDKKTLCFYFIGRQLKQGIKKSTKSLDKYTYHVFKVDISEQIQKLLYNLTIKQLSWAVKKNLDLVDYDPISENLDQLFSYKINTSLAFADVVTNQLCNKKDIKAISNISQITTHMDLWAYTVAFCHIDEDTDDNEWIYTFRKIVPSQVAVDDNSKLIHSYFNVKSSMLDLIKGETINLDEKIDCIFIEDTFYIFQKTQFEKIAGIEDEFKNIAIDTAKELKEIQGIKGLEILDKLIEEEPSIHRKIVRLNKTANYKVFTKKDVPRAIKLVKKFGEKLEKDDDGDIVIKDKKDFELLMRILVDFYKKGLFSGKPYGSFGGKELKEVNE